jgi:hypothetical protein
MGNIAAVRLERASPDMQRVLGNLLELYSHELSDVFSLDVGGCQPLPAADWPFSRPGSRGTSRQRKPLG